MTLSDDILTYHQGLSVDQRTICEVLAKHIAKGLPTAVGKVWHGHPVWFIDANPVVGYSLKKAGIEVLFWSGQSFSGDGLRALGQFKAAAHSVPTLVGLDENQLVGWLREAQQIQWDYANLPKKRSLDKATEFEG